MNSNASLILIPEERLTFLENTLANIGKDLAKLLSQQSPASPQIDEILSTKEAMAFLKFNHVNTFKAFLKRNNISSIDKSGPKRFLKSHLLLQK